MFIFFVTLLFAHAIPETDYAARYDAEVMPFYSTGVVGHFRGREALPIAYVGFDHPAARGVVVLVPGYNESFRKYAELAYDLYQDGLSVYALDHRGQGASPRFLPDRHKGHVDRFDFFIDDLKTFVDHVVPRGRPRYLLAHSLGGAIAANYLEENPEAFDAAVLSAPMLEIQLGRNEALAAAQLLALEAIGQGREYAPGRGDYDPLSIPFEKNDVTHSEARYLNNRDIFRLQPELVLTGQTVHWVSQAIQGSVRARVNADRNATPTLLLQAGEDTLVKPAGQKRFCDRSAVCQLVEFKSARHEILQETDEVRAKALSLILDFFR